MTLHELRQIVYICEICQAELRTRQGYRGHQRFRHGISAGGKRGGNIFTAREGEVCQVDPGEEGSTLAEAQNLAYTQRVLEVLLRIETLLVERGV